MRISWGKSILLEMELLKNGAPSLNVRVPSLLRIPDFRTKKNGGRFSVFLASGGIGFSSVDYFGKFMMCSNYL